MSKGTDQAAAYLKRLREHKDERAALRGSTFHDIVQAGREKGYHFELVDLLAILPIPELLEERWLAAE